ncbi:MAG TPA: hypothetical protein VG326_07825 [Tepidisphaeraceae bacterium]|jgi:hypothetical protein|nr:hypothetical protein [Tepidisphaeraceae bacterium]
MVKFTVYAALALWVPLTLAFFAMLPSRKAVMTSMIGGWLFLPVFMLKMKAIPACGKITIPSYACLLGTMLFDWHRLMKFRLKWFDMPMIAMCCIPYISSIQNDLGWYDGVSDIIAHFIVWGLPYFLGRIYFPDWDAFRELGIAIFIGGLIYIPFCLFEIRFSPQLHKYVYGFFPTEFVQSLRFGGYRPMCFLQHGLAVGMWMTSACLVGFWMWQCGTIKTVMGLPLVFLLGVLFVTTVLCKSTGGLLFLLAGVGILYSIKIAKTPILLLAVMAVGPTYMYLRASGTWNGDTAKDMALKYVGPERAQSLGVRIDAENILSVHALEQPWFGWGRWNRNRVYDAKGKDLAITDGLWILTMGEYGIIGLCALVAAILICPLMIWWRCPLKMWTHPGVAPAVAMAVLLALYMLDNILNSMPDPIFALALGGLTGIGPSIRAQLKYMNPAPTPSAARQNAYMTPPAMPANTGLDALFR